MQINANCFVSEAILSSRPNNEFRIKLNPNDPGSAAIFSNYPAEYTSTGAALAEEVRLILLYWDN
jgi:hypothetical protein